MPTPLLYQDVLKRAWMVTKKYKALWFFGLFSAPIVNGGVFEFLYRSFQLDPLSSYNVFKGYGEAFAQMSVMRSVLQLLTTVTSSTSPSFPSVLLSVLIVTACLFLFVLMVFSLDALISGVRSAFKNTPLSIRDGLRVGRTSFWQVAFTLLASTLVMTGLLTVLRALFSVRTGVSTIVTGAALIGVLVVMATLIFVYFIAFYTIASLIIKRQQWTEALQEGFQLAKQHWLVSLELSLVLFIITLLVGLVGFAVIMLFIGLPFYFILYTAAVGLLLPVPAFFVMALQVLLNALVIGLWGILSVFQVSSWTMLYLQLQKNVAIQSRTAHISKLLGSMIRRPTPSTESSE